MSIPSNTIPASSSPALSLSSLLKQSNWFDPLKNFSIEIAPSICVGSIAGYYSLGIAYETGLMAKADIIAIRVIKHFYGYGGVGALMPTFQSYSAMAVRVSAALAAVIIYKVIEKSLLYLIAEFKKFRERRSAPKAVQVKV